MNESVPPALPPVTPPPIPPLLPPGRPGGDGTNSYRGGPKSRVGLGWKVTVLVLAAFLGVSLLMNVILGGSKVAKMAGHSSKNRGANQLEEVILEDNDSKEKVVVIDLAGVIGGEAGPGGEGSLVDQIHDQLDHAAEDDQVKAVVLRVDSPGGEVLASDEIYKLLVDFQKSTEIPVITSMGSVAASGGYYISAASRWIVANELTITGSIGVIFHTYNYRGLMDKIGVRPNVIKSGKLKDMLSPDKRLEDELPEEQAILKDMINDSFTRFKAVIREGRGAAAAKNVEDEVTEGRKLAAGWEDFADGRILSGKSALELGLVDELGNFDTALDRAKSLAGIEEAKVVTYQTPFGMASLLRLFGKTDAHAVKLDIGGLELMPRIAPGRLYFMSPVYVH